MHEGIRLRTKKKRGGGKKEGKGERQLQVSKGKERKYVQLVRK